MANSKTVSESSGSPDVPTDDAAVKPRGFAMDVVMNAFEPGVNSAVIIFLNAVFVLLLCTLAIAAVFVGLNIHIIILSVLALGLMISFNWLLIQLYATEDRAVDSTNDDSTHTKTKTE